MKDIDALVEELLTIRREILEAEAASQEVIGHVHPHYTYSAINFIRYLKLRTFDLRKLQFRLSAIGLSSISHSERHVLANIENILHFLFLSKGQHFDGRHNFGRHPVNLIESQRVLKKNTNRLLKTEKGGRRTAIMVTLSDKATDYGHVKELVMAGMQIARINCSQGDQILWQQMVNHVKAAVEETGMACSIYFDLAGPKIRTSRIKAAGKKNHLLLHAGDLMHLYKDSHFDEASLANTDGKIAIASCAVTEIFDDVEQGDSIWFDDGKISGVIEGKCRKYLAIRITKTNPKGGKLREKKGINLPETNLRLASLTKEDLDNLPFVTAHADIIGLSFVRKTKDIQMLQEELGKLNKGDIGLVLKIENKEAFNNLPSLILQGMRSASLGVMTARGDLAVELGVERLSEVQEQILWLCEAALIPNIWATQVLETLAKKGIAARAEITDAAMSARSECVMLNKGDYILEAVKTLVNILERMEKHQYKKQGTLRLLQVAERFFTPPL